jgi:ABC-type nitrate/sulfonate/bicarbonate transport system substrate-binding protein
MHDNGAPFGSADVERAGGFMTSRRNLLKLAGAGALAVGAGALVAACSKPSSSNGPAPSSSAGSLVLPVSTSFKVATGPGDNFILDAVNADQHQFSKYNLDVPAFLLPTSGVQGMQLLAAGGADGMVQDVVLTLGSFANSQAGHRPVIIGQRVPETTYSILVAPGTWPDKTASFADRMKALKGKRVGVTAIGAGADIQLRLALEAAGMAYTDVTPLAVGQPTPAIAQMKANRIDAYVGITWATTRLMAALTGGSVLADFNEAAAPDILRNQSVGAIVVREDFAQSHQDVAKAWLAAQWDGKDWVLANRAAAADLLNKGSFNGQALDICNQYISHFADALVPKLQPMFKVTKADLDFMIDLAVKLGTVKAGQVKYEDIVPAFARA